MKTVLGGLNVDNLVVVIRVNVDRQVEPLRVGAGKSGVAVGAPLHRGSDTIAVSEVDVVSHANLIPVVDDRCSRKRKQQGAHEFDFLPVFAKQGRKTVPDA